MNDVKDLVGKVSQSNHYLVSFSALNPQITEHLGGYLGIRDPINFLSRKSGLLCSDAVLPTTSYATGEVKDNFMGIPQEFAHTRLYTDIDFSFYIDTDYTNLRIFEGWMDFISSGSLGEIGELTDNYYKRYRYPDEYKVQTMFISKFEKSISSQIDYQFINAFPKTMTTIPVSYGDAELLKVNVTFNYDRYVVNPQGSYTASNLSSFTDIERTRRNLFTTYESIYDRISSYASGRKNVEYDRRRNEEIQAIRDDYGGIEDGTGLTKEQAKTILDGGFVETVIDGGKGKATSGKDTKIGSDPTKDHRLGKEPKLDRITGEPKLDRITGDPGERTAPTLNRGGDNKIGSDPTKDHRLGEDSKGKYRVNSRGRKVYY